MQICANFNTLGGGGIQLQAPLLFYMGYEPYKIFLQNATTLNRPALSEARQRAQGVSWGGLGAEQINAY